jgi:GMP reductase
VDLNREYTFCHSKRKYKGIPIVAANMDTTGTFAIAKEMAKVS